MPDVLSKEELLEKRVDAMMSVERPEPEEIVPPTESPKEVEQQPAPEPESKPEPVQPAPSAPLLPGDNQPAAPQQPRPKQSVKPELAPHPALIDDIVIKPAKLDTPRSDAAVAEIAKQDSDAALEDEDQDVEEARKAAAKQDRKAQKDGHPIFWFFVLVFAIVCLATGFYLMRPDLFQHILP